MTRSNCFVESYKAHLADKKRGKFNIRVSRCGRFLHCYYTTFSGEIVNFLPPGHVKRKPFPPPLFYGVLINHDEAWRCHIQLRELGVAEKELRALSDDEVIEMFRVVNEEMALMGGDY